MKNQRIIVTAVLLTILIVPSILYFALTSGEHNFSTPHYFGPRKAVEVVKNGRTRIDTSYYTVPQFKLVNQNGQPFGSANLAGKIYVVAFFSTTGGEEDNRMATLLKDIEGKIINDHRIKGRNFAIAAITTTPESDSTVILKAYANRLNANDTVWNFLTGPKDTIVTLAKHGFLLNELAKPAQSNDVFKAHTFLLIDKEGHIRGVCNGTILMETNKMVEDIKTLYAWYARPKKGQKNIPGVEQHRD